MLRIFWVEPESLFRSLLVSALEHDGECLLVGKEPTLTDSAMGHIQIVKPDVLVVGIPRLDFASATALEALRNEIPSLAIVVLLAVADPVDRACLAHLRAGDNPGYAIIAEYGIARVDDLMQTIRTVVEGRIIMDTKLLPNHLPEPTPDELADLSQRESQVLSLMAAGLTNGGIGERLFITTKTVERHTQNIYTKIGSPPPAIQPRAYAVAKFQASAHDPYADLLKISA
jgi:DNA-binding NarL/FixJ family response regulator